jgi:hypothetical protein
MIASGADHFSLPHILRNRWKILANKSYRSESQVEKNALWTYMDQKEFAVLGGTHRRTVLC